MNETSCVELKILELSCVLAKIEDTSSKMYIGKVHADKSAVCQSPRPVKIASG